MPLPSVIYNPGEHLFVVVKAVGVISQCFLSPCPAMVMKASFGCFTITTWQRSWTYDPRTCRRLPRLWPSGVFHLQGSPHSASTSLPKLLVKSSYWFMTVVFSSQADLSYDSWGFPVPPDFGVAVCPVNSVFCWFQEKSVIFSLLCLLL